MGKTESCTATFGSYHFKQCIKMTDALVYDWQGNTENGRKMCTCLSSAVRLFLLFFFRQGLPMMCRASSLCVCAHVWSQHPDSVLILFFFLLSFFFFQLFFFFLLHVIFLLIISVMVFLYLPFSHSKGMMLLSNASILDLRNLLLRFKKAWSHLQQTVVLKCIR